MLEQVDSGCTGHDLTSSDQLYMHESVFTSRGRRILTVTLSMYCGRGLPLDSSTSARYNSEVFFSSLSLLHGLHRLYWNQGEGSCPNWYQSEAHVQPLPVRACAGAGNWHTIGLTKTNIRTGNTLEPEHNIYRLSEDDHVAEDGES